jgi:hypothetical protein
MLSIHISLDQVKGKVNECRRIKGSRREWERGKTIYILIFMTQFFFIPWRVIRIKFFLLFCQKYEGMMYFGVAADKQENLLTDDYLKICGFLCLTPSFLLFLFNNIYLNLNLSCNKIHLPFINLLKGSFSHWMCCAFEHRFIFTVYAFPTFLFFLSFHYYVCSLIFLLLLIGNMFLANLLLPDWAYCWLNDLFVECSCDLVVSLWFGMMMHFWRVFYYKVLIDEMVWKL